MGAKKIILVLGSNGMLGHMVRKCFHAWGFRVEAIDTKLDSKNIQSVIQAINLMSDCIVVNCMGKINQKLPAKSEIIFSNVLIPSYLAIGLKEGHFLVHPSTDCIFSGDTLSKYEINDCHDADDIYGVTKSIAEQSVLNRPNSLVLRGSIIGPHPTSSAGLMQWFLELPENCEIDGYTNHFWNGITTLQWCKNLRAIVEGSILSIKHYRGNLVQLGTNEVYSKYQMLLLFKKIFNKQKIYIKEVEKDWIYRCLEPTFVSPALEDQLKELTIEYYKN